MTRPRFPTGALACAIILVGTLVCDRVDSGEEAPFAHAEVQVGHARVRVVDYEEQYGELVPALKDRRWRTVMCVEVIDHGVAKPRRVWQRAFAGRRVSTIGPDSIILSDAANGHCLIAYSVFNTVLASIVELTGEVEPLPTTEGEVNPKAHSPSGKRRSIIMPEPEPIPGHPGFKTKWLGKPEIGMDLDPGHRIWLKSAAKTKGGWRIDATVYITFDPQAQKLGHKTILRFAILLDEECKSAKFEVVK